MPRPTTKKDLLAQSQKHHDALIAFIDDLSPADRERDFKPGTMNRNLRDVLAHLHHWLRTSTDGSQQASTGTCHGTFTNAAW